MRILFDHGTPRGLSRLLAEHTVNTAKEMGWDQLTNGRLLRAAEDAGFDLLLTTDQGIRSQQNLSGRKIALVVLTGTRKWSQVQLHVTLITTVVESLTTGSYEEVFIPFKRRPPA